MRLGGSKDVVTRAQKNCVVFAVLSDSEHDAGCDVLLQDSVGAVRDNVDKECHI